MSMNEDRNFITATEPRTAETLDRTGNYDLELGFISIDGPIQHRTQRFPFTMLRLGRILTAKEWVVREITLARLGRLMTKHQHDLPGYYTPKEIHEQLFEWGELRGGGIGVEWLELGRRSSRSIPDYHFTFTRIYQPESPANNEDAHS
jgi:hypothetical protein